MVEPYVLADAAYPLLEHLVTPFKGTPTFSQRQINYVHSSNCMRVEHVVDRVKNRWCVLKTPFTTHDEKDICMQIAACFVLHNLCIDDNDCDRFDDIEEEAEDSDTEHGEDEQVYDQPSRRTLLQQSRQRGVQLRQ